VGLSPARSFEIKHKFSYENKGILTFSKCFILQNCDLPKTYIITFHNKTFHSFLNNQHNECTTRNVPQISIENYYNKKASNNVKIKIKNMKLNNTKIKINISSSNSYLETEHFSVHNIIVSYFYQICA
jgi:hypothetical protein